MNPTFKVVVIGGSAGCFEVLIQILHSLPPSLNVPVVIVMHRLKNVVSEMDHILSFHAGGRKVAEPDDKEKLSPTGIYLSPQNYHLLIEDDMTFSLDYSEAVHFSRPSIDVTFESIANVFGKDVLAILLSGASSDGTKGIAKVLEKGGTAIVQSPETAAYSFMPQHAIECNKNAKILAPDGITNYLRSSFV